jgi:Asp-tRNA(Asn)/Glu-tRNA(Gln) amidotransferase A subunit family amidase
LTANVKPSALNILDATAQPSWFGGARRRHWSWSTPRSSVLLESFGHLVELAHPSILDDAKALTIFNRIWPLRLLSALQSSERELDKKAGPNNLDPDTLYCLDRAHGVSATDYIVAMEDMDAFTRALAAWWDNDHGGGYDVLVTPVTGTVTSKLGALGMDSARLKTSMLWWHEFLQCTPSAADLLRECWSQRALN